MDIPWKWLNFFLNDDAELKTIGEEYQAGKMLTGQVKKRLIEVITPDLLILSRILPFLLQFTVYFFSLQGEACLFNENKVIAIDFENCCLSEIPFQAVLS